METLEWSADILMKTLLIKSGKVSEVEITPGDLDTFYKHIGCTTMDSGGRLDEFHMCYVDDESWLKDQKTTMTRVNWRTDMGLIGNILVVGIDAAGETIPAMLNVREVEGMIEGCMDIEIYDGAIIGAVDIDLDA